VEFRLFKDGQSGDAYYKTQLQAGGNGNSYKSPDSVNRIDWRLKNENSDVFEYYKKLIQLRKDHPVFRITQVSQIQEYINFCFEYKAGMIGYSINGKALGDSWEYLVLIFNGNRKEITVNLPDGKYQVVADGNDIREEEIGGFISGEVIVEGI